MRELHYEAQLALAEEQLDVAHDAGAAADRKPLADLERLLAAQVAGLAATG